MSSTPCVGDWYGNGQVTIDELITMVNIALGDAPLSACPAGDADGRGDITIDEIIAAVNNALAGCPRGAPTASPTPTATATPSPTATPTACFIDQGNGTILDCVTNLLWEKKSDDGSLHDKDFHYVWAGTCSVTTSRYCQPERGGRGGLRGGRGVRRRRGLRTVPR